MSDDGDYAPGMFISIYSRKETVYSNTFCKIKLCKSGTTVKNTNTYLFEHAK